MKDNEAVPMSIISGDSGQVKYFKLNGDYLEEINIKAGEEVTYKGLFAKIIDENEKESILHIEFQTSNHKEMHFRMLRYLTELYKKYKYSLSHTILFIC